jgi:hypothetical protein
MTGQICRYFNRLLLSWFDHWLSPITFAHEKLSIPVNATLSSTVKMTFDLQNTGAKGGMRWL